MEAVLTAQIIMLYNRREVGYILKIHTAKKTACYRELSDTVSIDV